MLRKSSCAPIVAAIILILLLTACGSRSQKDRDIAIAVALTQTATAQEVAATPESSLAIVAKEEPQQAEIKASYPEWQTYVNPLGFSISYPPQWQRADTSTTNSPFQEVTLSGPEGAVVLNWGSGFGGGCPDSNQQKIAVADGELVSCYSKNADGTESWGNIYAPLPNPDIGFSARAHTLSTDPSACQTLLQVFATLTFETAAIQTAGNEAADGQSSDLKSFTIRIDPGQAPSAPVALYAEVPGTLAGPRNHIFVEGNGSVVFTMELTPGEYLFYGYQTSSTPLEMDYFGAWGSDQRLALVDISTVDEIILRRPTDPCNPDSQLIWGSPDFRFPPTNSSERLAYIGCVSTQPETAVGPTSTPRALDVGVVGFDASGWQSIAHPVGFVISYPPNWEREEAAENQVLLSGPEGGVELSWNIGLGGACPEGLKPIGTLNGEVMSCHVINADGTEAWEQIYLSLPETDVAVRGYTSSGDPAAIRTVLRIFATLEHDESIP